MDVTKCFEQCKELGLQQETFHVNMEWDQYVEALDKVADDKELKKLLLLKQNEDLVDNASLDTIMRNNFMSAKGVIDQMTIAKRIKMLEEVKVYREYLYSQVDLYGKEGISRDEQISARDYQLIMGRIKHLEIVQNWLYGII